MMNRNYNMETIGQLIDVIEDWLEDKGFSTKDFSNYDREMNNGESIIYGEDYGYLSDRFSEILGFNDSTK